MDHLTEPGMKDYLHETFQKYKEYKMSYYTKIVNVCLFLLFAGILGTILYYKKKAKMTPQQKYKKNEEDRNYIIQKIRSLQLKNGMG